MHSVTDGQTDDIIMQGRLGVLSPFAAPRGDANVNLRTRSAAVAQNADRTAYIQSNRDYTLSAVKVESRT